MNCHCCSISDDLSCSWICSIRPIQIYSYSQKKEIWNFVNIWNFFGIYFIAIPSITLVYLLKPLVTSSKLSIVCPRVYSSVCFYVQTSSCYSMRCPYVCMYVCMYVRPVVGISVRRIVLSFVSLSIVYMLLHV